MKFGLFVLLGLCAFAAATNDYKLEIQERNIITDKLHSIVDNFVQDAVSEFSTISNKITGVIDNTRNSIASITSSAKTSISSLTGDVSSKLGALIAKGGNIKACAEQIVPQLSDLKNIAETTLTNCVGGFARNTISYEQEVSTHIVSLKNSLLEVYSIVEECTNFSLINAVECATDLITKAKTLVTSIISETNAALQISSTKGASTIASVRACSSSAIASATADIQSIRAKTQQCSIL